MLSIFFSWFLHFNYFLDPRSILNKLFIQVKSQATQSSPAPLIKLHRTCCCLYQTHPKYYFILCVWRKTHPKQKLVWCTKAPVLYVGFRKWPNDRIYYKKLFSQLESVYLSHSRDGPGKNITKILNLPLLSVDGRTIRKQYKKRATIYTTIIDKRWF